MTELTVNEKSLELQRGTSGIKYTKRISEIYNLAAVASSYTNAFRVPKTPNNTQIFQQLGLIGDTSNIPYERVPVTLSNHGFPVIKRGWLQIMETDKEYKVNIIDGMVEFFKAIENKTMGVDLDLSEFNHTKTMFNVLNSFVDGEYYKYIVADYNGKRYGNIEAGSGINIDYLVPCFSVQKLWEKIFTTFGYTYNPEPLSFLNGLYITYPKPPQENAEPELIAAANKTNWNSSAFANWQGQKYVPGQEFWSSATASQGSWQNNWQFIVPESGSYMFEVEIEAYVRWIHPISGPIGNYPAQISIMVNGTVVFPMATNPDAAVTGSFINYYNQGDVIQVRLSATKPEGLNIQIRHNNTNFKIYKVNLGEVSLSESLKDFAIKDFIKEIIWRTALTPVIDADTNYIDFIPMSQRLNFANAIDWSNKYVKRVTETYDVGISQKNAFRLNHNNQYDTRGDGFLYVNDKNLKDEQTLAASKLFAPEIFNAGFEDVTATTVAKTDTYRVWEKEPNTNQSGEMEIEYKGLNNRYHFIRYRESAQTFRFVSEYLNTTDLAVGVPFAVNNATLFDELIFSNWAGYSGVLNSFRMHTIELALSLPDIVQLDMTRPYYFAQEGQYYMLSALTWEEGKTCKGQFIRINTP